MELAGIVNLDRHALDSVEWQAQCKAQLDKQGALVLDDFLTAHALERILAESERKRSLAYYTQQKHNVYISDQDPNFADEHPRNFLVESSKGCITDDLVDADSPLRVLYDSPLFHTFLCAVLGEAELFPYADNLSSINVHYAGESQELGWHFDNSAFATTLLIQKPEAGGEFEYIGAMQFKENGERDYDRVAALLRGTPEENPVALAIEPGSLVLFRGHNAIHRVTPVVGHTTRVLVVFAYNTEPGIALSESARKTFYGR